MIKLTQELLSTLGEPDVDGIVRFEGSGKIAEDGQTLSILNINDQPVSYKEKDETTRDVRAAEINAQIRGI